ncbi:unnamed protein product [Heligmosomoides polygyrus]|uniref:Homeobox domain-containing protein n=1 Tax=Heligmosomoides polygyrus TaxID=6339 RepID=A0A183GL87_HELPZ|nr:unnamed protein product [Heligmosomoides polygyrus]
MTLFVSLERGGSIGPLWHATGTNGDAAGARSSKPMIKETLDARERWNRPLRPETEFASSLQQRVVYHTPHQVHAALQRTGNLSLVEL